MNLGSTSRWLLAALCVAGCSEYPQVIGQSPVKRGDVKPWESAPSPYAAADWKGGDQAAWEAQMRSRAQGQNEYSRGAAAPAAAPTKTP